MAAIFADATRILEGPTLQTEDTRRDYGEVRIVAVGRVASGRVLVVVFTMRGTSDDPRVPDHLGEEGQ